MRHIEPQFYRANQRRIDTIFESYAVPFEDSPELCLTPKCFEDLCQDNFIFNKETFERFFDPNHKRGYCRGVDDLIERWEDIKLKLKEFLKALNSQSLNQLWVKVDGFILSVNESSNKHKLWLNFKLLECETNRLFLESRIRSLIPASIVTAGDLITQYLETS